MTQDSISYKLIKVGIIILSGLIGAGNYWLLTAMIPEATTIIWAMPVSIFTGVATNIIGIEILERTCLLSSSSTAKKKW